MIIDSLLRKDAVQTKRIAALEAALQEIRDTASQARLGRECVAVDDIHAIAKRDLAEVERAKR